jgi:predicted metal-binding protein
MEPLFKAHLFVCTNDRGEGAKRPSCARRGSEELRQQVKAACKAKGFGKSVRINSAGCLDQCERGIAAVLYPSGKWLLDLGPGDAETLVAAVEEELKK